MDTLQPVAPPLDRRRTIDYLRRKARSVEQQAARAAPAVAAQLKSLAAAIEIEAAELERAAAVWR